MSETWIIHGDCLEVLDRLPRAKMIFADPPDNIGYPYEGFTDKWPRRDGPAGYNGTYECFFHELVWRPQQQCDVYWLSHSSRYEADVVRTWDQGLNHGYSCRRFVWTYTFGQHNRHDFGTSYRPIVRIMKRGAKVYPDAVRMPSARMAYGDKRADPRGRVPSDVWTFPRVCGTFKERRRWASTQHPEALMERIIRFSCVPGDLVIDLFGHSFTTARVCKRLGVHCISTEISEFYCAKGAEELGCEVIQADRVHAGVWPPKE